RVRRSVPHDALPIYANGITDHPRVAVHRTRRPVALAHFVEHGTTDTDTGIGFKAGPLATIVFLRRLQQTDHAGLNQIVDLYAGRDRKSTRLNSSHVK